MYRTLGKDVCVSAGCYLLLLTQTLLLKDGD